MSIIRLKRHFFTLRSIFAVLSRTAVVIFCICLLLYYLTLILSKFVPICDQLLFLFIGRILTLFFNKALFFNKVETQVSHNNIEALSPCSQQ